MDFLSLCQRVARESGTVGGSSLPSTVVAQTGRLGDIVRWTNDAWRTIQTDRSQWRWMLAELTGSITSGTQRYTGTTIGVASRFGRFVVSGEDDLDWSCYRTATGASDEGPLTFLDWGTFYRTQLRGTPPTNARPIYFSIDNAGQIVFSPTPNATYTVRGFYRKSPQDLTANVDIPEMPTDYHMLIVWEALKLLGNFDEGQVQQRAEWANNARLVRFNLERDQLPQIGICGALA